MKITRVSPRTGTVHEMDLPVTTTQIARWEAGCPAQVSFPNLDANQREFIMTGYTQEDWTAMFGPDNDGIEPDPCDLES